MNPFKLFKKIFYQTPIFNQFVFCHSVIAFLLHMQIHILHFTCKVKIIQANWTH
ncbi:hypothetical protein X975_00769, partial [Stegodyphus mimosarum]